MTDFNQAVTSVVTTSKHSSKRQIFWNHFMASCRIELQSCLVSNHLQWFIGTFSYFGLSRVENRDLLLLFFEYFLSFSKRSSFLGKASTQKAQRMSKRDDSAIIRIEILSFKPRQGLVFFATSDMKLFSYFLMHRNGFFSRDLNDDHFTRYEAFWCLGYILMTHKVLTILDISKLQLLKFNFLIVTLSFEFTFNFFAESFKLVSNISLPDLDKTFYADFKARWKKFMSEIYCPHLKHFASFFPVWTTNFSNFFLFLPPFAAWKFTFQEQKTQFINTWWQGGNLIARLKQTFRFHFQQAGDLWADVLNRINYKSRRWRREAIKASRFPLKFL